MRLYAPLPELRRRQIAADVGLLVWTVAWALVAAAVHGSTVRLANTAQQVADLGRSITSAMHTAADVAGRVPLVGGQLSRPFGSLAEAAGTVGGAGRNVEDAAARLAVMLAIALVVIPVGWALMRWLPWRLRWARESATALRLLSGEADLELLAAHAMASASLTELAALPAGTAAAWRASDPAAVRALAGLQLRRLGLPDGPARAPAGAGPQPPG